MHGRVQVRSTCDHAESFQEQKVMVHGEGTRTAIGTESLVVMVDKMFAFSGAEFLRPYLRVL